MKEKSTLYIIFNITGNGEKTLNSGIRRTSLIRLFANVYKTCSDIIITGRIILKDIMRMKVRILRPAEYKQLLTGCPKPELKTTLQALMYTGMRYIEMKRFQKHPSWYDGVQFIHLPKEAVRKQKRVQMERIVRLSPPGRIIIEYFLQSKHKIPAYQTWQENLQTWARRAGMSSKGLCSKTTRKTMESWLTFYYPHRGLEIALSQGHTTVTSLQHYLNMPFTEIDRMQMKEFVEGW